MLEAPFTEALSKVSKTLPDRQSCRYSRISIQTVYTSFYTIAPSFSYLGIGTVSQSAKRRPFDLVEAVYSRQQCI